MTYGMSLPGPNSRVWKFSTVEISTTPFRSAPASSRSWATTASRVVP